MTLRVEVERRDLALKIVAAEYDHLEAVQQAIIASKTATDAEKERARIIPASLPSSCTLRHSAHRRTRKARLSNISTARASMPNN